ncbi:hypothetical protein FOZ63_032470 [Perkinsus olseni]|uniref:Uncharacterized protein n=1 Tax=Perkinsus olseni TaxID=32597 RepID=A0A7J6Q819_PEROL|nr:hypothetical protein FOZ63_032470 [Perkinsus olseni]KAF4730350.1 hypothetical protein FOZ62_018481 [Perkinsus olseni]
MVSVIVSALGFLLASSRGTMAMQTTFEPAREMNESSRLSPLEGQVYVLSGVATTLHREIDMIIGDISELKRKPSESVAFKREVESGLDRCDAKYADSLLTMLKPSTGGHKIAWISTTSRRYVSYWKTKRKATLTFFDEMGVGNVTGRPGEIMTKFQDVFPFYHLMDMITGKLKGKTSDKSCLELFKGIESNPPKHYQGEMYPVVLVRDSPQITTWIRKFIDDKMPTALRIAAE